MHKEELRQASEPRSLSDEELMSMIRHGGQAAFAELHRRYLPRLDGFLSRYVHDSEERRDIIQDTFIRVYQAAERYSDSARFSTWIHTIAMNLARTRHRRNTRRRMIRLDDAFDTSLDPSMPSEPADHNPTPEDLFEQDYDLDCTLEKLQSMRPEYSTAILMRDFLECSYLDIVRHTGESMGTVKSRINRARALLREEHDQLQRVRNAASPDEQKHASPHAHDNISSKPGKSQ